MYQPCENGAPLLGFDGENVVRTWFDSTVNFPTWTFVHGPGTDDPLMGHYTSGVTAYWVTDGAGRQFAVGNAGGYDCTDLGTSCGNQYDHGGKYAGGISNARSFGAERHGSSSVYKVSFFRNRFYDQQTGRWTQEDPIGVAGGTNLYAYVENNPVAFTDPFGLCKPWPDCSLSRMLNWADNNPNSPVGAWINYWANSGEGAAEGPAIDVDCETTCKTDAGEDQGGQTTDKKAPPPQEPDGGHKKNPRESNRERHERGNERRRRDQGDEKGDKRRRGNPNKRRATGDQDQVQGVSLRILDGIPVLGLTYRHG
jgi:RHS repeat-associated protein